MNETPDTSGDEQYARMLQQQFYDEDARYNEQMDSEDTNEPIPVDYPTLIRSLQVLRAATQLNNYINSRNTNNANHNPGDQNNNDIYSNESQSNPSITNQNASTFDSRNTNNNFDLNQNTNSSFGLNQNTNGDLNQNTNGDFGLNQNTNNSFGLNQNTNGDLNQNTNGDFGLNQNENSGFIRNMNNNFDTSEYVFGIEFLTPQTNQNATDSNIENHGFTVRLNVPEQNNDVPLMDMMNLVLLDMVRSRYSGTFFEFLLSQGDLSYEQLSRLVDVPKGADKETIEKMVVQKYSSSNGSESNCTVCLSNFEEGEEIMTLGCKHCFHKDCITRWLELNKTCPICRKDISEEK